MAKCQYREHQQHMLQINSMLDSSLNLIPLEWLHHLPGEVSIIPSKMPISSGLQKSSIAPLGIKIMAIIPGLKSKFSFTILRISLSGIFPVP